MTGIIGKLYEKLWRKVGGKPWTEIVREDQKASPLVYLLIFLDWEYWWPDWQVKTGGKYWSGFCSA